MSDTVTDRAKQAHDAPTLTPMEAELYSLRFEVERLRESAMQAWQERDEAVQRRQEIELDLADATVNLRECREASEAEIAALRGTIHNKEVALEAYRMELEAYRDMARSR